MLTNSIEQRKNLFAAQVGVDQGARRDHEKDANGSIYRVHRPHRINDTRRYDYSCASGCKWPDACARLYRGKLLV
jgi:hypothetical protein